METIRRLGHENYGSGHRGEMGLGQIRVRRDEWGFQMDAVRRSIERRTGLKFCGGPRYHGGDASGSHYSGTLGRHLGAGNGFSVVGEIWFCVP